MRLLEVEEAEFIKCRIQPAAMNEAEQSPCQKSQRGAVVFIGDRILGGGFNTPEYPRTCEPKICLPICSFYTTHAERKALQNALARGYDLTGASVFHIKLDKPFFIPGEGRVVRETTSGDPSCDDCSGFMIRLSQQMPLKEFILFQSRGYIAYQIEEFHNLTLAYLKKHS